MPDYVVIILIIYVIGFLGTALALFIKDSENPTVILFSLTNMGINTVITVFWFIFLYVMIYLILDKPSGTKETYTNRGIG